MVPDPAEASGPFEAALLQRGVPFVSAVEAEGYELQLSLISDGVGLGLVMPQVTSLLCVTQTHQAAQSEGLLSNAECLDIAFQTHRSVSSDCSLRTRCGQAAVAYTLIK
jgi:hypothetical protein